MPCPQSVVLSYGSPSRLIPSPSSVPSFYGRAGHFSSYKHLPSLFASNTCFLELLSGFWKTQAKTFFCCFIKLSWEMSRKKNKKRKMPPKHPSTCTRPHCQDVPGLHQAVGLVPGERSKCVPCIPLTVTGAVQGSAERPAPFKQTDNHSRGHSPMSTRECCTCWLVHFLQRGGHWVGLNSLLCGPGSQILLFSVMSFLVSVYSTHSWSDESNSLTDRTKKGCQSYHWITGSFNFFYVFFSHMQFLCFFFKKPIW